MTETERAYSEEVFIGFPAYLSFDEYLTLPNLDGFTEELIEGELIASPRASARHAELSYLISRALDPLRELGFVIVPESTVALKKDKASVLGPDVAVFDRETYESDLTKGIYAQHVLLAIEVLSPGNTPKEMLSKVPVYFELGAYAVWLVEQGKGLRVLYPNGESQWFDRGVVATPHPLPRVDVDFDELFRNAKL